WFDPDPIHLLAPDPPPPLDPDTWLFDLVHGVVTDTTAQASLLEWELACLLQPTHDIIDNPNLSLGIDGTAWFTPGPLTHPRCGTLLPPMIQALLADPDLHLRLTTPADTATDPTSSTTYRPGKALARAVRTRDHHCRFPGCTTPATQCDLDHARPWPQGPTTIDNLHTLCRFHHLFKHHAHWTIHLDPDGTATWTAPTGRQHTTTPPNPHDLAA
nr:HNH endonuclease [Dermatophilaceae bacterium]